MKNNSMIQNLPNYISILRIILSFSLILIDPLSSLFWSLYALCGISDIADGFIARKFRLTSKRGEILDSAGDMVMVGVLVFVLFPVVSISVKVWAWIAVIAMIRFIAIGVGYCRFHVIATIHTYTNKATGLLLFLGMPFYILFEFNILVYILCLIATVSALEELLIQLMAKTLSRNTKGLCELFTDQFSE